MGTVSQDCTIQSGPCPNCGDEASAFFGDILSVKGEHENLDVTCANCTKTMTFIRSKQQIVLAEK